MDNSRKAVLVLVGLLSPSLLYAQSIAERAESDEVTFMSSEEPAMRRAFERAKATLDEFLRVAANPPAGTSSFALKVAISDGRNTEYFWVNKFASRGNGFVGTLNNEPRLVMKYKLGQRINFKREQIVDWIYLDESKGRMHGNFTACALLSKESPADAEEFKRSYGLHCD